MAEAEARELVPKIGLPEVDRIVDGCKLKYFSTFSPITPPETRSIRKFRELTALAARSNTPPPLPPKLDNVDRISRMPDEILRFIVSHLTMREAATTSVLSPRWRTLWTTSLSCLNFDVPNMLGHDYPNRIFKNKSEGYKARKRSRFTKWVNHVIAQFFCHGSLRLDALRVSFILNNDSTPDIDRWIISSVARGVTDIYLDFQYDKFFGSLHDPFREYVFPAQQVASTIRHLHLKFCKLNLPPNFTGFPSLVSLSLFDVYIDQAILENIILARCPLLEYLSLGSCCHPDNTTLKFAGTSLRLKHLHIRSTDAIIKVHNINLLSFELIYNVPRLSIKNAPYLARLVLLTEKPIDIMRNTPRLETLFLALYYEETCDVLHTYVLNNLKRLVFVSRPTENYLRVVRVLKACHSLQKLELDMGIVIRSVNETIEKVAALPGFPLNNLREIEIYGFEDNPEKIELVKYLLNNAIVLQKMKIYTPSKNYYGNGRWQPLEENPAISLEKFHELLPNVLLSSGKVELFNSHNL